MEILIVLSATVFAFSALLAALAAKSRAEGDDDQRPTCARCDCHRRRKPPGRAAGHLEAIEKTRQAGAGFLAPKPSGPCSLNVDENH